MSACSWASQSQRVPTDAAGNASPGAVPIGQILVGTPVPTPVPAVGPVVYIERALLNPSGADPGLEVVVLSSLSTAPQKLANWRLVDKNGRVTPIDLTIKPGQSVLLTLDGSGVQLGNNGGTVRLLDDGNGQVDVVTYTGADGVLSSPRWPISCLPTRARSSSVVASSAAASPIT
jgi:hypothetical protein